MLFYKKIKIIYHFAENIIYIISVVENNNRDANSPNSRKDGSMKAELFLTAAHTLKSKIEDTNSTISSVYTEVDGGIVIEILTPLTEEIDTSWLYQIVNVAIKNGNLVTSIFVAE